MPHNWLNWPHERLVYMFLCVAFLILWGQAALLHGRAGFHNRYMWGPVLYTPVVCLASVLLAMARAHWSEVLFVAVYGLALIEGLFGTYQHLRGVRAQPGGFSLRNFMHGPPALLPLLYALLALFGLLVYYWDEIYPLSKGYMG